ncbi:DUF1801 domain-containing protein [Ferruginibacter sp. SUN106]|uniref:DUF1801 domain-containing protein n=1 Tax=Ferruginibacter sp. SUN106 TaxID=2978348 RepID=UPI003D3634CC
MAKNKTVETRDSVAAFVAAIKDEKKRNDFSAVIDLITKTTKMDPKMWGTAIVGFGMYHYKYDSGREGEAALLSIAARANALTFYLGATFDKREELLLKLGKHKVDGGCVHIQKLEDIDTGILMKMVKNSIANKKKLHPDK